MKRIYAAAVIGFLIPLFIYWAGGGDFVRSEGLGLALICSFAFSAWLLAGAYSLWGINPPTTKNTGLR